MAENASPSLEASLDAYLVREHPVREFLVRQARRAPWWACSFLVHTILLLLLWRWPLRSIAVETTDGPPPIVKLYPSPPPAAFEPLRPDRPEIPPEPAAEGGTEVPGFTAPRVPTPEPPKLEPPGTPGSGTCGPDRLQGPPR